MIPLNLRFAAVVLAGIVGVVLIGQCGEDEPPAALVIAKNDAQDSIKAATIARLKGERAMLEAQLASSEAARKAAASEYARRRETIRRTTVVLTDTTALRMVAQRDSALVEADSVIATQQRQIGALALVVTVQDSIISEQNARILFAARTREALERQLGRERRNATLGKLKYAVGTAAVLIAVDRLTGS